MTATAPLPSWTRTLNADEALVLLDAATPGLGLADWAARAHELLPQASLARRREVIRMVREELLDHEGEVILDAAFGRLLQAGSPHRRRTLLWARLLARRPLAAPVMDALVLPALARADAPLAPDEADLIPAPAWDAWLRAVLHPEVPPESFKKTRSTLQAALTEIGVLAFSGGRARLTHARHAEPDMLGWAWALAAELRGTVGEISDSQAIRVSFPARLFATRPEYAAACVEAGVAAGLLRRSYLAGSPRLLVGAL
jgi:hypothetical protein